ncbi:hypothetical protein WPS_06640 [Vulcanimicrobium alpinum]|uniref:Uncharacterized protein n=1 Tax=Vulcanimicrobium alpinum TaxID=3016050 RepID=A0AAN1XTI6_UNVUL|nr:hypothetical protein [Vulcanimicrobium alpinum]BDE05388.1 hypothetical protein WPS_06640 [Vulcanimicrobium alpinum]
MGPKYRGFIHDFRGAVAGYAGAGVAVAIIIHWVVIASPVGDPTLKHMMAAMGAH